MSKYVNTYPEPYRSAPQDSLADPWKMYNRECTSYVAWLVQHLNGYGININAPRLGDWNAQNWDDRARQLGFAVDKTARIGSVAEFESGHVAYVVEVADNTVHVLEYNFAVKGGWGERDVPINSVSSFVHFPGEEQAQKALGENSATTTPPTSENFDDAARRVIRGDFGNGSARTQALASAGLDPSAVQKRVNEMLGA